MDDIAESLISRFISQLKARLIEAFEVFDIEMALPLILDGNQCKKLLGVHNDTRFQEITAMPDFPKIVKKGKHPRYPRDAVREWVKENWRLLA
ncbi:DNA-binding protein [Streptococcus canis]|uniref:DNA-binding protein n=1 Tax=Streptococcus canis TaxID=1329 RepID=UPI0013DB6A92|nr:DNA-binding protein [Streptococcus canis]QKG73731.1 DNA-binding protein [Streptococcus canis]